MPLTNSDVNTSQFATLKHAREGQFWSLKINVRMELVAYWISVKQKCLPLQFPHFHKKTNHRGLCYNCITTALWGQLADEMRGPILPSTAQYFCSTPGQGRECESRTRRSCFKSWQLLSAEVPLGGVYCMSGNIKDFIMRVLHVNGYTDKWGSVLDIKRKC